MGPSLQMEIKAGEVILPVQGDMDSTALQVAGVRMGLERRKEASPI